MKVRGIFSEARLIILKYRECLKGSCCYELDYDLAHFSVCRIVTKEGRTTRARLGRYFWMASARSWDFEVNAHQNLTDRDWDAIHAAKPSTPPSKHRVVTP